MMLTNFSFDSDFLKSNLFNDNDIVLAHSSILELWKDYGVLVLPANGKKSLFEWISNLPPKFRQRWMLALEYYKTFEHNEVWQDFSKYSSFENLTQLSKYFKTALTEDTVGILFCDSDEPLKICTNTNFEIVGAGFITESINFSSSKLYNSSIPIKTPKNTIWVEKFMPLCQYSDCITIVDRYLFENILNEKYSPDSDSSIKNFLKKIASLKATNPKKIKIISHGHENDSEFHHKIFTYFNNKIIKNPPIKSVVSSITLISKDELFFQKESHDRHIGFDIHVCEVGVGMAIFDNTPTPACTFTMKHISKTIMREVISSAEKRPLWREHIF